MIGYLEGTLKQLDATRALVLAGGVGYEVHISLQTYYKLEGQKSVALQIFTHVREDALSLYGFASAEEKFAFGKLISISGIDAPDLAEAVTRGDVRKLSSIPGVGKKTADRIILELRDKLLIPESAREQTTPSARSSMDDDVHSALINLGYKPRDAEAALEMARKELGSDAELSALLKAALRQLTRS